MIDLDTGRAAIGRDIDATIDRLATADPTDWDRPTRCAGWTVREAVAHFGDAIHQQAGALQRMLEGRTDQTHLTTVEDTSASHLLAVMRASREEMVGTLRSVSPADLGRLCPLPFGVLPGAVALQICIAEAGHHRNDIDWAFGDESPLPAETAVATSSLIPAILTMLAGRASEKPEGPVSLRVAGASFSHDVAWDDGEWVYGPVAAPSATVSGDDSAAILFIMGRIPATDDRVTVTGDGALAGKYKAFFPGP